MDWLVDGLKGYHVLGWLVTILGFLVAALVARAGWKRTAEAGISAQRERRALDDENSRKILKEAITEGLGTAIVFIPDLIDQLKRSQFFTPQLLMHLDEGRRAYDRNKDNMVHWKNEEERQAVQLWFREAAVWRAYMDQYVMPRPGEKAEPTYREIVRLHIETLEAAFQEARGLYEEMDLPRVHKGHVGYEKWAPKRLRVPARPDVSEPEGSGTAHE